MIEISGYLCYTSQDYNCNNFADIRLCFIYYLQQNSYVAEFSVCFEETVLAPKKYSDRSSARQESNSNEILGAILIIVSAFLLLCMVTGGFILADIGRAIFGFMLGFLGYASYPILLFMLLAGIMSVRKRKIKAPVRYIIAGAVVAVATILIAHLATSSAYLGNGFGEYLSKIFSNKNTVGGVVFGTLTYLFYTLFKIVFTYILLALTILAAIFFASDFFRIRVLKKQDNSKPRTQNKSNQNQKSANMFPNSSEYSEWHAPVKENSLFVDIIQPANKIRTETAAYDNLDNQVTPPPKQSNYDQSRASYEQAVSTTYEPYKNNSESAKNARDILFGDTHKYYEKFLPQNHQTEPDIKPVKKQPESYIPEVVLPEPVEVQGYIPGVILNGDDISEQIARESSVNKTTDQPQAETNLSSNYTFEPETPSPRGEILNGDLYNKNINEQPSYLNDIENEPVSEPEEVQYTSLSQIINGDVYKKEEKSADLHEDETLSTDDSNENNNEVYNEYYVNTAPILNGDNYTRDSDKGEETIDEFFAKANSFVELDEEKLNEYENSPQEETLPPETILNPNPIINADAIDESSNINSDDFNYAEEFKHPVNTDYIDENYDDLYTDNGDNSEDYYGAIDDVHTDEEVRTVGEILNGDIYADDESVELIDNTQQANADVLQDGANSSNIEPVDPVKNDEYKSDYFNIEEDVEDKSEYTYSNPDDHTGYYNPVKDDNSPSFDRKVEKIDKKLQSTQPSATTPSQKTVSEQIDITTYTQSKPLPEKKPVIKKPYKYTPPPLDLLVTESDKTQSDEEEIGRNVDILLSTLDSMGFPNAEVTNVIEGPAVTRYEITTPFGNSIKRITNIVQDLSYNLASKGTIRIESPIPGKRAIGIEVPKGRVGKVGLKDIISSKEFQKSKSPLTIALGKDIAGNIMVQRIDDLVHLLIAGTTGSGKSACLNSILVSLIYHASPEDLKLILIDPKRVGFAAYRNIPHLLTEKPIVEQAQVINAFKWLRVEMDRRYDVFGHYALEKIDEYNQSSMVKEGIEPKMPYIVMIIDEYGELINTSSEKKIMEESIVSIASKARAAGIHLILATQRPSADVVTGTIKANLPSRIAFKVSSAMESRIILDTPGAEALLGKGDMLSSPMSESSETRIQGAYVEPWEVREITEFAKTHNSSDYDQDFLDALVAKDTTVSNDTGGSSDEDTYDKDLIDVVRCVMKSGRASSSMIQGRFRFGWPKAARIMEQMEQLQFIGPQNGTKAREVYITKEKFEDFFGEAYE